MRRLVLTCLAVAALLTMAVPAFGNEVVPRHLHLLTTPNGDTHAIAAGLTFQAPCTAFLNFHEIVHETVFGTPGTGALRNPNGPLVPLPVGGSCTLDP
jgi:hypothetical protein